MVMAKELKTEILIKASPDKVWAILTDFKNYHLWNPFIQSLEGDVVVGQKIKVVLSPPDSKKMTFKPIVLGYETSKQLRWLGHLGFKGIFDGEHKFLLIDNGDGTTTFKQEEYFKGLLVPLFKKMLDNNTLRGFKLMNEKLKERAERSN